MKNGDNRLFVSEHDQGALCLLDVYVWVAVAFLV